MRSLVERVRRVVEPRQGLHSIGGTAGWLVVPGFVLPLGCGLSPDHPGGDTLAIAEQVVASTSAETLSHFGPVYVALRSGGSLLVDTWTWSDLGIGGEPWGATSPEDATRLVASSLTRAMTSLPANATFDTAEISLAHHRVEAKPEALGPSDRGLLGIEFVDPDGRIRRIAPTQMIAANLDWDAVLSPPWSGRGATGRATAHVFRTQDFLVVFAPGSRQFTVHPTSRGNQIVPLASVTRENTERLAAGLADWLGRNVATDGRLLYKYWPSEARESEANNTIRQFLGNVCLQRLARAQSGGAPWLQALPHDFADLAARNLRYDLDRFYAGPRSRAWQAASPGLGASANGTTNRGRGLGTELGRIRHDGKVKLGAIALAGLAIHESPTRAELATEAAALFASTQEMWEVTGAFRTFLEPADRNDCQNFYPGETLYSWAHLLTASDAREAAVEGFGIDRNELARRFFRSVAFYRDWHRTNRNPAFVPWHTRACYLVWKESHDPALAAWIFEMNDWLLGIQQWDDAPHADMVGRFYAPGRPYGPPHASSTGVYMEGLIDAFALARELGDVERMTRYREALLGGLRSAMQLQFVDAIDLFYVRDHGPVAGALRTTVYDNEIRVDNVQHVLMAVLDILATFEPADFADSEPVVLASARP